MMDDKRIAELRKERNSGMVSAVGEYTPAEFWEALDEIENLRAALKWYAEGQHFAKTDESAWDTVSGEPQNWWCDEAGAGMVEDGTLAAKVLAGELTGAQMHADDE